jgi:hypothetical protein
MRLEATLGITLRFHCSRELSDAISCACERILGRFNGRLFRPLYGEQTLASRLDDSRDIDWAAQPQGFS